MKPVTKWMLILSGMALSFGAGFILAKKKFDDLNDTQIEEIRLMYEEKYKKPQSNAVENQTNYIPTPVAMMIENKPMETIVNEIVKSRYENMIHIISPIEYGEDMTYDAVGLTYYSDGVLARDDDDTIIENIDEVIGINSLKYLGEYADGVLYIKNDILNTYYEITDSDKTYAEVTGPVFGA
jgi:hypothetical protein